MWASRCCSCPSAESKLASMRSWNDDDGDSARLSRRAGDASDGRRVRDSDDVTTGTTRMSGSAASVRVGSQPQRKLIGQGYEKRGEIGRGTYGTVYDGVHVETQRHVAIKKVIGRASVGEAEAALLRACEGADHVVQLLDVVRRNDKLYLVLEFMDSDLETILQATDAVPQLHIAHIKGYLQMLLRGVDELHRRHIVHRDIKPNNLLISKHGRIAKLTDFGMATQLSDTKTDRALSLQVITRAYRPPELFFGHDKYGTEVDMWSVGCVFAEMVLRQPFVDGSSDIDQLSRIFAALGSPTENGWSAAADLPFHLKFKDTNPTPLKDQFPELSEEGVNLLTKLLQVDPTKRISAADALKHPYFQEAPAPATGEELPMVLPADPTKKRPLAEVLADAAERHRENGEDGEVRAAGGHMAIKGRRIL